MSLCGDACKGSSVVVNWRKFSGLVPFLHAAITMSMIVFIENSKLCL